MSQSKVITFKAKKSHKPCKHLSIAPLRSGETFVRCSNCDTHLSLQEAYKRLERTVVKLTARLKKAESDTCSLSEQLKHLRQQQYGNNPVAQILERVWLSSDRVPCCPHCDKGLLVDDFAPRFGTISITVEKQKRAGENVLETQLLKWLKKDEGKANE